MLLVVFVVDDDAGIEFHVVGDHYDWQQRVLCCFMLFYEWEKHVVKGHRLVCGYGFCVVLFFDKLCCCYC